MQQFGQLDCLHFIDLNQDEQVFNLTFANQLKWIEDLSKKVDLIEYESKKIKINLTWPKSMEEFMKA